MSNFIEDISNWWWWVSVIGIAFIINIASNLFSVRFQKFLGSISNKRKLKNAENAKIQANKIDYYTDNWLELIIDNQTSGTYFLVSCVVDLILCIFTVIIASDVEFNKAFHFTLLGKSINPFIFILNILCLTYLGYILDLRARRKEIKIIYKIVKKLRGKSF